MNVWCRWTTTLTRLAADDTTRGDATRIPVTDDMQIGIRDVDGLQIRVATSTSVDGPPVVLTSPWPESLLAFDRIWDVLSRSSRLWAVDLPGFGRSERRADLLTPQTMGTFLIRLLDALDLESAHLVCPDVGTPAALFAASTDPQRIRSLVIGGGATAYPLDIAGALADIVHAPDLSDLVPPAPSALVAGLVATIDPAPSPDVIDDYVESNAGDRFVEAARYVRSYPEQLHLLAERIPHIFTSALVVAGQRDALVPASNAEALHRRLPNSRLQLLDAGHHVWEQRAPAYAELITEWLAGGYLTLRTSR